MLFAPKILKNSLLLLDGKHKKHYLNERERETWVVKERILSILGIL